MPLRALGTVNARTDGNRFILGLGVSGSQIIKSCIKGLGNG
jgi:hypothetical protein